MPTQFQFNINRLPAGPGPELLEYYASEMVGTRVEKIGEVKLDASKVPKYSLWNGAPVFSKTIPGELMIFSDRRFQFFHQGVMNLPIDCSTDPNAPVDRTLRQALLFCGTVTHRPSRNPLNPTEEEYTATLRFALVPLLDNIHRYAYKSGTSHATANSVLFTANSVFFPPGVFSSESHPAEAIRAIEEAHTQYHAETFVPEQAHTRPRAEARRGFFFRRTRTGEREDSIHKPKARGTLRAKIFKQHFLKDV